MSSNQETPQIPLPRGWKQHVRSSVLHVISLAQYATVYTRSWAADSVNCRVRLRAELDRANQEHLLLQEELRIKDARMMRIDPQRRPHYPPVERMAILQLRAARGWSLEQAAGIFHLTAPTISSWIKRLEEEGADALVQLHRPVNRFPDFVRYVVQRLKTLCPTMGKRMLAQTLARAGLHLSTTTVGRILNEKPVSPPQTTEQTTSTGRVVTAKRPNHVWHIDLTVVPAGIGMWCAWLPFALPQRWPFCWWVLIVVDHFSRRAMGLGVFATRPNCRAVCTSLGQTVRRVGSAPKYIVCDRDSVFDCDAFRRWVKRKGIRPPRYGAVGKHGSMEMVSWYTSLVA
jgi:transposase